MRMLFLSMFITILRAHFSPSRILRLYVLSSSCIHDKIQFSWMHPFAALSYFNLPFSELSRFSKKEIKSLDKSSLCKRWKKVLYFVLSWVMIKNVCHCKNAPPFGCYGALLPFARFYNGINLNMSNSERWVAALMSNNIKQKAGERA